MRAFVEKPGVEEATALRHQGALWNTFVFTSTMAGLLRLYDDTAPWLLRSLARAAERQAPALDAVYFGMPACDFSRDILQKSTGSLRLLHASSCGWTDVGTPDRLAAFQARASDRVVAGNGRHAAVEMFVPTASHQASRIAAAR